MTNHNHDHDHDHLDDDHHHHHTHPHEHDHSHEDKTSIDDLKKYLDYYINHLKDHEVKLEKLKDKLPKELKTFIDKSVSSIKEGVEILKDLDKKL